MVTKSTNGSLHTSLIVTAGSSSRYADLVNDGRYGHPVAGRQAARTNPPNPKTIKVVVSVYGTDCFLHTSAPSAWPVTRDFICVQLPFNHKRCISLLYSHLCGNIFTTVTCTSLALHHGRSYRGKFLEKLFGEHCEIFGRPLASLWAIS